MGGLICKSYSSSHRHQHGTERIVDLGKWPLLIVTGLSLGY